MIHLTPLHDHYNREIIHTERNFFCERSYELLSSTISEEIDIYISSIFKSEEYEVIIKSKSPRELFIAVAKIDLELYLGIAKIMPELEFFEEKDINKLTNLTRLDLLFSLEKRFSKLIQKTNSEFNKLNLGLIYNDLLNIPFCDIDSEIIQVG